LLVILLLYPLQDGILAILPEMVIKRERFPDVQPFHDGKAHRIAIAERLVLIWLDNRSSLPFVRIQKFMNASNHHCIFLEGVSLDHSDQDSSHVL